MWRAGRFISNYEFAVCVKCSILSIVTVLKCHSWQSILLSDDSSDSESATDEDEEEGEEFTLSREELHNMLRLHKYKKLHQSKYSKDKEVKIKI